MSKKRTLLSVLTVFVVVSVFIIGFNMGTHTPTKIEPVDNPLLKIIENENPVVNIVDNSNNEVPIEFEEEVDEEEVVEDKIIDIDILKAEDFINPQEKNSIQNISRKYNDKLAKLEREFEHEFNSLINSAISDYNAGITDTAAINMYIDKGYDLEYKYDKKFYSVISDMESELRNYSHYTTLVAEVMAYYENFKFEKKNYLMSKGMELILE